MTSGRGNIRRTQTLLSALALALAAALATPGPSAAAEDSARTYVGPAFSTVLPATRSDNQSKTWFHADAWWALLLGSDGRTTGVYELMPDHTWRATTAVVNPDTG